MNIKEPDMIIGCRKMGSLPNLHELERIRRRLENENEMAKREQRAREQRESSRDREKLPIFLHPPQLPYNPQLLGQAVSGIGGHHSGCNSSGAATISLTTTTTIGGSFGITAGGSHIGGFGIVGFGTPNQISKQHQHQHRHSLTTRHRVMRTRSSGASYNIWDDPMIEQMAAYSPVSSRSHRITAVPPYQVQAVLAASRRRESINSSIGANSIRRLISLNNRNLCRHKIPAHVRAKVCKNFIFLAIAHGLTCAILVPLIGLQGSNSIWHHKEQWINVGPNIGSMLLSISFLLSCGMCFLTTRLIRKIDYTILIASSYIGMCLFLACHLYPSIYTLIPAYVILGITLGPAWVGKIALVIYFANKLSCSQHDCNFSFSNSSGGGGVGGVASGMDGLIDEHKVFCNRDQKVRRLTRWFYAAQDIGIILGATIASVVLACSISDSTCFGFQQNSGSINLFATTTPEDRSLEAAVTTTTTATTATTATVELLNNPSMPTITQIKQIDDNMNDSYSSVTTKLLAEIVTATVTKVATVMVKQTPIKYLGHQQDYAQSPMPAALSNIYTISNLVPTDVNFIYDMYNHNEHGERICGADLCPIWHITEDQALNGTFYASFIHASGKSGGIALIGIYLLFAIIALTLTLLIGQIDLQFRHERIKGMTDTLLFAGPLAYFIGTEQAYMLGDFMRAYVSCTLGLQMVAGALIGMGIMQTIVSCTLSMLLRHTKRTVVIAAGFFFHSCLLFVLTQWKPSKDDSALFYVIAAAWGACNAMWETLLLALITLTHTNQVAEVLAPLQALRFLGLGITFAAHGFLCENPKILILGIILVISIPPYAMLEIRLETQRKSQMISL